MPKGNATIAHPREWLLSGGGGHEGGAEGLKVMTVTGEGLVSFLEAYAEHIGNQLHEMTGYNDQIL